MGKHNTNRQGTGHQFNPQYGNQENQYGQRRDQRGGQPDYRNQNAGNYGGANQGNYGVQNRHDAMHGQYSQGGWEYDRPQSAYGSAQDYPAYQDQEYDRYNAGASHESQYGYRDQQGQQRHQNFGDQSSGFDQGHYAPNQEYGSTQRRSQDNQSGARFGAQHARTTDSYGSYNSDQYGEQGRSRLTQASPYGQADYGAGQREREDYGNPGVSGFGTSWPGTSAAGSWGSSYGSMGTGGGQGGSMAPYSNRGGSQQRKRGAAPKGYKKSDQRIMEDVSETLMDDGIDCSCVDIQIKDGTITLSGEVESRDDKHRIEHIAAELSGVQDVENQLRIKKRNASSYTEGKDTKPGSGVESSYGSTGTNANTGIANAVTRGSESPTRLNK